MKLPLTKQYPRKRAFVTGAGAGIGRALCEALAVDGWAVGVADVNASAVEEVSRRVRQLGGTGLPYVLDVSRQEDFTGAAGTFVQEAGGVDVLINNAGVADLYEFHACSDEVWERIDRINRRGVIHGCQAFVPVMREQQSGTIVNVASVAAFASPPGLAAYSASKASVLAISECLYAELKHLGVRVSVAIPFVVATELFTYRERSEQSRRSADQLKRWFGVSPEKTARVILEKAARNQLHIPTSWSARLLFAFKRQQPQLFMDVQAALARRFNDAE